MEAKEEPDVQVDIVDIAPRWRKVHQVEIWRRLIGGGIQLFRDVFRITSFVLRDRPEVLHLCSAAQLALIRDIVVLWLSKRFGVRSIYHLRFGRLPILAGQGGWEWGLITHSIALADRVVVLDKKSAQTIEQEFPHKDFSQLPDFLDEKQIEYLNSLSNMLNRDRNLVRVTFIGWVIPTKGVLELVEAVVTLSKEISIELEIIGPCDPKYVRSIRITGRPLKKQLLIRGELPHPEAMLALSSTDIFVLPSYTEGFPNVVIEAMALGKPVIATNVGAIPEMLGAHTADSCGVVIPSKDVEALENSLRILLFDAQQRKILGERARKKFEETYSAKIVFKSLKEIWINT